MGINPCDEAIVTEFLSWITKIVITPSDSGFVELPETFLHVVMMLKTPFSSKYMKRTCQMIDYSRNLTRNSRHETNQSITAGDETERKPENFPGTPLMSPRPASMGIKPCYGYRKHHTRSACMNDFSDFSLFVILIIFPIETFLPHQPRLDDDFHLITIRFIRIIDLLIDTQTFSSSLTSTSPSPLADLSPSYTEMLYLHGWINVRTQSQQPTYCKLLGSPSIQFLPIFQPCIPVQRKTEETKE